MPNSTDFGILHVNRNVNILTSQSLELLEETEKQENKDEHIPSNFNLYYEGGGEEGKTEGNDIYG